MYIQRLLLTIIQKYFRSDFNFVSKNTEIELFSKYVENWAPEIAEKLTTKKIQFDPSTGIEDTLKTNAPFKIHMKRISDLMLTKLFSLQIDLDCFIKLLDLLILDGYDLIHKIGLYMVDYLKKDTIHKIKKFIKKSDKSEDNVSIAAILSTEKLMKPVKKSTFLKILKKVLKKNELELFIAEKKDSFLAEVKLNLPMGNEAVVVERVERIIKTKQEFLAADFPLNSVTLTKYLADFDQEVEDAVAIPYIPLKKFLGNKKGKFKWNERVINSLYLTIDSKYRGAIQPIEFKTVLTLLSNISRKDKLLMITSFMQENRSGIVEPTDAVIIIEKLEDIVCADLKMTSSNNSSVSYKIRNKFSTGDDKKDIPVCDLLDFAKEVAELSALFSVLEVLKLF